MRLNSPDVSETWSSANIQFDYFSDSKNGYTEIAPIIITNTQEYEEALNNGFIQPGDLMYFEFNSKHEGYDHAAMITGLDGKGYYYSGKTNDRHMKLFDPSLDLKDERNIAIVHLAY